MSAVVRRRFVPPRLSFAPAALFPTCRSFFPPPIRPPGLPPAPSASDAQPLFGHTPNPRRGAESQSPSASARVGGAELRQEYREHCVLGWSPAKLYRVVADVAQYSGFLPWCVESHVHSVTRGGEALNMIATLTVGFSFYKEKYTSEVLLIPDRRVQAVLTEEARRKNPVLRDLRCLWEFHAVPGSEQRVEVCFHVSFAFRNPMHSKLIMSNIVSLMTRSFEKHCEKLYGPPSCPRERLTG